MRTRAPFFWGTGVGLGWGGAWSWSNEHRGIGIGSCQVRRDRKRFYTDLDSGLDFIFGFSRCLRIDLTGSFSLISVVFFKSVTLGMFLGPTLAENQPKTKKHPKTKHKYMYMYVYIYIYLLVSCSESK